MELEQSSSPLELTPDIRPRMLPPPPVRLVAVDDVLLVAGSGQESLLDAFYVQLLRFERLLEGDRPVYEAENFRIRFDWRDGLIERDDLSPLGIEVPSLADAEQKLIELEMEYLRQSGLQPGEEALVLRDPAGNWVQLVQHRIVG